MYQKIVSLYLRASLITKAFIIFLHWFKYFIFYRVLPNKKTELDRYQGKVFCGTYAEDGDVFMSAAQGNFFSLYEKQCYSHKKKQRIYTIVLFEKQIYSFLEQSRWYTMYTTVYPPLQPCIRNMNYWWDKLHLALIWKLLPLSIIYRIYIFCFSSISFLKLFRMFLIYL